jgi:tRNA/rRNA methyltransferase
VVVALTEGRKGPARGGVLDGEQAKALRALLAEHGEGRAPGECSPVRGLARLLRRNPTEAERVLWQALTNDRRLAAKAFKRQTPIGSHIADFVSFPLRTVIDLVPEHESEAAARSRQQRRSWLVERGYRVLEVPASEVESDLPGVLARLVEQLSSSG